MTARRFLGLRRVQFEGHEVSLFPCRVPTCEAYCDPAIDPTLLCTEHAAMVPAEMFERLDQAAGGSVAEFGQQFHALLQYAIDADAVIND